MFNFPIAEFFSQFFAALPALWLPFVAAWLISLAVLVAVVFALKRTLKPQILDADARIRAWARRVRYDDALAGAAVQTAIGAKASEPAATSAAEAETLSQASADATASAAPPPDARERVRRTAFFRFWTNFASAPSLSFFSLALAIWATGNLAAPRWFYLPGLCYAGSMLLSWVSKRVFQRARPERAPGAFGHKLADGSFPSGHSLTSFCFWVMLPVAAFLAGLPVGFALALFLAGFAIVALTGLSRIYLGVHFPSDVLGGFGIGAGWCSLCYLALRGAL